MNLANTISKTVFQVFRSLNNLSTVYIYTNANRVKKGAIYEDQITTISGKGFFLNSQDNERQIGSPNVPNRLQKTASIYINRDDFKLSNPVEYPAITGKISVKGELWSITNIDVSDFYFKMGLER